MVGALGENQAMGFSARWAGLFQLILWLLAAILLLLLFVGGLGDHQPRFLKQAWNLGHVVAFALWSYLAATSWRRLAERSWGGQFWVLMLLALLVGGLTEVLQGRFFGRDASVADVLRDGVGALVTTAFLLPARHQLSPRPRRFLWGAVLLALGVTLLPLGRALVDEALARRQFPVLADFETPFEIDRWQGRGTMTTDRSLARHGHSSSRIMLSPPSRYPGVSLYDFPGDWRGYTALRFSLYSPAATPRTVHCRVHDQWHRRHGQHYADRFSTSFELHGGWNDIVIPLATIVAAPKGRRMDMAAIEGFGIFVVDPREPVTLWLDQVRLE